MKIFKTKHGIVFQNQGEYYQVSDQSWDEFINDDQLLTKLKNLSTEQYRINDGEALVTDALEAPIGNQEIWASGVTYYNSKLGREEESKDAGGGAFYGKVYVAERPELFFKSTAARTIGPGGTVRIRKDSTWDAPEPELTLFITSNARIVGYTIGNDMSSRSIEGENPLYLPQAKMYDGSAALGPCIYVTDQPLSPETEIELLINRKGAAVLKEKVAISQIKRKFDELVSFLYREISFPNGSFLMTGTGIVPSSDFTLHKGDEISITIAPIGTLTNTVN